VLCSLQCAPEETPVLPPTSSAHPFQVFLRRTPTLLLSTPTTTICIAHPGPRVTVASDPTRPQARSRNLLYRTVPEETPRHPKGKLPTHWPVHLHSVPLSHQLVLSNLPSKTFIIVFCSLVPCLDSVFSLFQLCPSSAAICYCNSTVRFNKAFSTQFPQPQSTSFISVGVLLRDTYTQALDIGVGRNPPYPPSTLAGPSILNSNLVTLDPTYLVFVKKRLFSRFP
jgi:hypothetical protein